MAKTAWIAALALLAAPVTVMAQTAAQGEDPVVAAIHARADKDDVEAMLDMASFTTGAEAQAWLERAAQTGDGEAMYQLAVALNDGRYGVKHPDRMLALQTNAAQKGNGAAVFDFDTSGDPPPVTPPYPHPTDDGIEQLRWDLSVYERVRGTPYERAVLQDIDRLSQTGAGAHYTDWRQRFEHGLVAANHGDATEMRGVASAYMNGMGVAPDRAQAEAWFRKLAELGEPADQAALAERYAGGVFGPGRDDMAKLYYAKAADGLKAKAAAGDASAMTYVGSLYEAGWLSPRTGEPDADAQALAWMAKAADAGNALAMIDLAMRYGEGRGVAQDKAASAIWLTRAAGSNDPQAVAASPDALPLARQKLGEMYMKGDGVAADDPKAVYWLMLANDTRTEGGDDETLATELALCRERLTAAQKEKVQDDVTAWHKAHDGKGG